MEQEGLERKHTSYNSKLQLLEADKGRAIVKRKLDVVSLVEIQISITAD
jgi:hypothetical protein